MKFPQKCSIRAKLLKLAMQKLMEKFIAKALTRKSQKSFHGQFHRQICALKTHAVPQRTKKNRTVDHTEPQ